MCGIAGGVAWGGSEALARMTRVQGHRGPDDAGTWETVLPDGTWLGLGNRRLAVIDLSAAGHMPMGNEDGSLWLTYNGELYNAPQLRSELEASGYRFRSRTDTEVVLRVLEEAGADGVQRLEGMFAFAAVDLRPRPPAAPAGRGPTVILARDPFGVKPLYYVQRGNRLAFASEAKALLELPGLDAGVDPAGLHTYLTFLWVPDPDTLLREVKKLPAAHLATFRDGELRLREYWTVAVPPAGATFAAPEEDVAEGIRERLRRSVQQQMVSDVPLGAFLSAGLDSSGIVAFLAEASPEPVRTYTITFPPRHRVGETTLDDPAVARRVSEHFGCRHREIVVEPDVTELLPDLVWYMDEPLADPAAIAAFLLCREARETVTVLLCGVGGDELFAGYRKHAAYRLGELYRKLPGPLRSRVLEPLLLAAPALRGTRLMGWARLARKLARSGSLPPAEAFLQNATYLDRREKDALYLPEFREAVRGVDPYRGHRRHLARVEGADFVNQMLYLDLKTFMVSLNLTYMDRMSMASSLEARVPYLDRALVEFAFRDVPPAMKLRGRVRPVTKYALRRAMRGVVPGEVLRQPKAGFGAPHDRWLAHDLREMVDDLLSEDQVRRRGYFRPAAVRALIREQREGKGDRAYPLWQLLTLELWHRAFVDGEGRARAARASAEACRADGAGLLEIVEGRGGT